MSIFSIKIKSKKCSIVYLLASLPVWRNVSWEAVETSQLSFPCLVPATCCNVANSFLYRTPPSFGIWFCYPCDSFTVKNRMLFWGNSLMFRRNLLILIESLLQATCSFSIQICSSTLLEFRKVLVDILPCKRNDTTLVLEREKIIALKSTVSQLMMK